MRKSTFWRNYTPLHTISGYHTEKKPHNLKGATVIGRTLVQSATHESKISRGVDTVATLGGGNLKALTQGKDLENCHYRCKPHIECVHANFNSTTVTWSLPTTKHTKLLLFCFSYRTHLESLHMEPPLFGRGTPRPTRILPLELHIGSRRVADRDFCRGGQETNVRVRQLINEDIGRGYGRRRS